MQSKPNAFMTHSKVAAVRILYLGCSVIANLSYAVYKMSIFIAQSLCLPQLNYLYNCFNVVTDDGREYDVFLSSYYKLTQLLPVENMLHNLITKRVIHLDDEKKIMSLTTTRKKAVYILHKIAAPLEAGYTDKFYQLLTIMEEYGGDVAKLADEIRPSLSHLTGKVFIFNKTTVPFSVLNIVIKTHYHCKDSSWLFKLQMVNCIQYYCLFVYLSSQQHNSL